MDIRPVTIVVDSRESRSGVPAALARIEGVTVETADLLCADYAIGSLGIERKAATDFIGSIMDGRLFEQVARLQTEYQHSVVLIEGDVYQTRSALAAEALDGALSWLALLADVKVLHVPNSSRTAPLLHRMALHHTHGLGYDVPLRAGKPKDAKLGKVFVIEGLPGVGPTTAAKLLTHFGSVRAVVNASDLELKAVPGVGPKLIDKIRAVVN